MSATSTAVFKGIWGQTYQLTTLLGQGGEGSVYETNVPGKVAKIYDSSKPTIQKRMPELEKKLTYMVTKIPMDFVSKATGNVLVPWPQDVLFEDGRFVGFLMSKITGAKPIKMIQHGNPSASQAIPGYNWKTAALVAENMAKVIKALHQYNIVVGDLNSGNIMVYPNGDVVIVDTDSFDIRTDTGTHFKCRVATEPFVPPELQGRNLNDPNACFSRETDQFALAVHIFLLLMKNYHPFNVRVLDTSVSSDESKQSYNITVGNCPHLRSIPGCEVPVGAPNLKRMLPETLVNDFAATFDYRLNPSAPDYQQQVQKVIFKRTTAEVWYNHLHEFNQNANTDLVQCSQNPEHFYLRSHGKCALCEAQTQWSKTVVQTSSRSGSSSSIHTTPKVTYVKSPAQAAGSGWSQSRPPQQTAGSGWSQPQPPQQTAGSGRSQPQPPQQTAGSGRSQPQPPQQAAATVGTPAAKKKHPFLKTILYIYIVFCIVYWVLAVLNGSSKSNCDHPAWSAATCTTPQRCTQCGKTKGSALGHNWSGDSTLRYCNRCWVFK